MIMTTTAAIIVNIAYAKRCHGSDEEDDNEFSRVITCTLLLKLPCVVWTSFTLNPARIQPTTYGETQESCEELLDSY